MKNKNINIGWKLFRHILFSSGKGASELFKIFKVSNKNIKRSAKQDVRQETKTRVVSEIKEKPVSGKIRRHTPKFEDFTVEKRISGDYELFRKKLNADSKIVLIFGKRGSGKTALGLRVMENIKVKAKRNCYVLGIKEDLIPEWIESINNIDEAKSESVILVDEGALSFNARDSMMDSNKNLSKIMAIARHKNLTILFITQNTGMIDRNVLKLSDSLMVKEGSLLQLEMERSEIKQFYERTKKLMDKAKEDKVKYFYVIDSDFEGLIKYSLPSFWTTGLSKNKKSY